MRPFRAVLVGLLLASPLAASASTFYLHHSASPVAVPGGTTSFFLDEVAPSGGTVTAESVSVPKKTAGSFPTFIAPAFGAPTTVGLSFLGTVNLSANHAMNGCATVRIVVSLVGAGGALIPVANGAVGGVTVPQASNGGTAGFAAFPVASVVGCASHFSDLAVAAGESIAVTVSVSNACKSNRAVSLAYDATSASSNVGTSPLPPVDPLFIASCLSKCIGAKITCALNKEKGAFTCEEKAAKLGASVDSLCAAKANAKFSGSATGCMEKAEAKPACATNGDAPAIGAKIDAFVAGVKAQVYANPPPTLPNACASGKMKCVVNLVKGVLTCDSKAIKTAAPVDSICLAKAFTKFTTPLTGCMEKVEAKACAGGVGTTGDAPVVQGRARAFIDDLACELDPAISFSISPTPGGGSCGSIDSASGAFASLACGDLNVGDGAGSTPPAPIPAGTTTIFNVSGVTTVPSSFAVCGRGQAQSGSSRNCSAAGCFFGSPLPIANGPLSFCVDNVFAANGSGVLGPATGSFTGDIRLQSTLTGTGNPSEPCPRCVAGMCDVTAVNATAPCVADATSGESHDCVAPGPVLSPIMLDLAGISTGTASMTNGAGSFCPGQVNSGAFGEPSIITITANGSPAGDLTAGPALPATLASVFCVPATGNALVDTLVGLPGPGALTLDVDADVN